MSFEKVYPQSKTEPITDEYVIIGDLGEGAFSVVKRGVKTATGESFAVKFVSKETQADELENLKVEVELMRMVDNNDHVIRLRDVFETADDLILVLDLVEGGELFEKIAEKGNYSEADAAHILRQIMLGLKLIHASGIIHRDLKPENLLCVHPELDVLDDVKIADFGEGIHLPEDELAVGLRGSPAYIAPEIWMDEPYDTSCDCWSIGVVAFILLGGYLPFEEPDPDLVEEGIEEDRELEEIIIEGKVEFPDEEWADVSADAKDFILQLLQGDPADRMSAAQALEHPFLTGGAKTETREGAAEKLKMFNAKRKWQAFAQVVMATNKLKRLTEYGQDKAKKTSMSRLRKIFQQADKDNSGELDAQELRSLLRKIFRKQDYAFDSKQLRKYARHQISEHDSDGNGTIDFEEFAELYHMILEDPELPIEMREGAKTSEKEVDAISRKKKKSHRTTRSDSRHRTVQKKK